MKNPNHPGPVPLAPNDPLDSGDSGQPKRALGTFDATCIVIGAIIGVGIFFTPSKVAALTQSAGYSIIAWSLAGFIALCGALAFAWLGQRYRANGAQYEILRDAYGPLVAFVFVFCNCTAVQAGAVAIISLVCVDNLVRCTGGEALSPLLRTLAAAALIVVLIGANIAGVKFGAMIQNLTVVAKVSVLAWIVILGFSSTAVATPAGAVETHALSGWQGVIAALVPAFFSYGGWQHALWITGEVKDPTRTVPRAVLGGVCIVVAVYIAANWAYFQLLGQPAVAASSSLAAESVARHFPNMGARFVAGVVAFSAFGVLNAQLLSGPRLVYGMARDGRFFKSFAALHPRLGTPWAAILLLGLTALALLFAAGESAIDKILTGVVFIDCVFFIATGFAIWLFHRRGMQRASPAVLAAVALFCCGELLVFVGAYLVPETRAASLIGLGWIIAATVLYQIRFRQSSNTSALV